MCAETTSVDAGVSQLFLDDDLVAESTNVTRRWHRLRKHPANPVMQKSGPETATYLFGTVIREPYRGTVGDEAPPQSPNYPMWYNPSDRKRHRNAYAESDDGLDWRKPDLGRTGRSGESVPAPNAVLYPPEHRLIGLSGVIRDDRPSVPDDERYKLMTPAKRGDDPKGYLTATSPDGLHWRMQGGFVPDEPTYADRGCFVWDSFRDEFVLYSRTRFATDETVARGGPGYFGRAIARCHSPNFSDWSTGDVVMAAAADDPDGTEIYGMAAFPYESQWVALPQVFRSLPELAYIDLSVAHSRDGIRWTREPDLVLPNGGVGEWDRFNQCASTRPARVADELWVYYSGRTCRHTKEYRLSGLTDNGPRETAIGLATLRLDGWCSYEASFDGGEILSEPVMLPDGALHVNAASAWGRVEVAAIPVSGAEDEAVLSEPVVGDGVALPVRWQDEAAFDAARKKPVRLRFRLENALLYSWKVE